MERAGDIGVGVGDQLRPPRGRDLRHLVHYDATGKALWLSMTANTTAEGVYSGTLYQTRGPAFSAVPFSPAAVTATAVGSGNLTFSDANNGTFAYVVNGFTQTKAITRQVFRTPGTVCQ